MNPYDVTLAAEKLIKLIINNTHLVTADLSEFGKIRSQKEIEELMQRFRWFVNMQLQEKSFVAMHTSPMEFVLACFELFEEHEKNERM